MSDLMEAGTILEQSGWKRPNPFQLCTDIPSLLRITDIDFDLTDASFRQYLHDRGVCSFKAVEEGRTYFKLDWMIDFLTNWSEDRVLNDEELSESISGLKLDSNHRAVSLKIWKINRGKIQDCWEIYNRPGTKELLRKEAEEKYENGDTF